MSRRLALAATIVLASLAIPALPASAGGGGCYGGATQGTGTTVYLQEACPTPAILHVDPGAKVTFVNKDPFAHNIIGILWGHYDDLNQGHAFTATFDGSGVYPYACWYHPGMTGAIIVGDGTGPGNGQTVSVESSTLPSATPVAAVAGGQAPPTPPGGSGATGWVVTGAIGLAIGAGLGLFLARRRTA